MFIETLRKSPNFLLMNTTLQTLFSIRPLKRLRKENQQTLLLPQKHQKIGRKVISMSICISMLFKLSDLYDKKTFSRWSY